MPGSFEHALDVLIDNEIDLSGIEARYRQRRDRCAGLRSGGDAQDRAACLQPRRRLQPRDRAAVPGERAVHGDLGRQRPAVHDDREVRSGTGRGRVGDLHAGAADLRPAGADRPADVRDRRGEAAEQRRQAPAAARTPSSRTRPSAWRRRWRRCSRPTASRDEAKDRRGRHREGQGADRAAAGRSEANPRVPGHARRSAAPRRARSARATSPTTTAPRWRPPKGVIQGYTAVAAVDSKAQIIVAAQAHGSGSEQSVLLPMVESTAASAHRADR